MKFEIDISQSDYLNILKRNGLENEQQLERFIRNILIYGKIVKETKKGSISAYIYGNEAGVKFNPKVKNAEEIDIVKMDIDNKGTINEYMYANVSTENYTHHETIEFNEIKNVFNNVDIVDYSDRLE